MTTANPRKPPGTGHPPFSEIVPMRSADRRLPGFPPNPPGPVVSRGRTWALMATLVLAVGCGKEKKSHYESAMIAPKVHIVHPEFRKLVRVVGQPSFVESYERTSIYPKLTGYLERWVVDIGDIVKKGDLLATLFVPEVVEDFHTKQATVKLDQERIALARKDVEVADADVQAAQAHLDEARSMLGKYVAEVKRWDTEVKRIREEVKHGVVAPQILLESTKQLESSIAERDAAESTIKKQAADVLAAQAELGRANVKVGVAEAALAVATSEAARLKAWVGYLTISAPFDGIIVARNANTFDFVLPGRGDPSADRNAPDLSPSGAAAPIYVVDRTDIVRIFIDIPEKDADYVHIGSKANVTVRAFRDEPIPGTVTRTAWALNVKTRTLRAEIDLTNPVSALLPGMYAYAEITIDRPGVHALPTPTLTQSGGKSYCWLYQDGKAQRAEVRTGVSDGPWTEILKLNHASDNDDNSQWASVTGKEMVIRGDLSILAENEDVKLDPNSQSDDGDSEPETQTASTSRKMVTPGAPSR